MKYRVDFGLIRQLQFIGHKLNNLKLRKQGSGNAKDNHKKQFQKVPQNYLHLIAKECAKYLEHHRELVCLMTADTKVSFENICNDIKLSKVKIVDIYMILPEHDKIEKVFP